MKIFTLLVLFSVVTDATKPVNVTTTTVSPTNTTFPNYDYRWTDFSGDNKSLSSEYYLYNWPQDGTLVRIYDYVTFVHTFACIACLALTAVELFSLCFEERVSVVVFFIWLILCDAVQYLGLVVLMTMRAFLDYQQCLGLPFYYVTTEKVVEALNIAARKISAFLVLILAGYIAFSASYVDLLFIVVMLVGSFIWAGVYLTQIQLGKFSSCDGYILLSGESWEQEFRLIDGYISFAICAGFVLLAHVGCCKPKSRKAILLHPLETTNGIILTSVFCFLFQFICGLLSYFDNRILPGYAEKYYFQLEKVIQICLILNSLCRCFLYFCVCTKANVISEVTTGKPAPARAAAPIITSQPLPAIHPSTAPATGNMMIPNVHPNMVPNMMLPNVVPSGNGQGNMQVSVVVIPMPGAYPNNS